MNGKTRLGTSLRAAWALGLPNLVRVGVYRIGVRTGFHPACRLGADPPQGPFFAPPAPRVGLPPPTEDWDREARYFGCHAVPLPTDRCPDWRANPLTGGRADGARPWWRIPDFDPAIGDIKVVWEASRLDWVLAMAQRAAAGRRGEIERLNEWLADWCAGNPPYSGPNWKCGQEAAIRVMHLAAAALLLGAADHPSPGLRDLVRVHLRRIAPVMAYARAQDNNHGTSEAAGLFIGGTWLAGAGNAAGGRWARLGRAGLEERIGRLVAPDGSFSQYSTNYHRLMLDTLSLAEWWRRRIGAGPFSAGWYERAGAATAWLATLIEPDTGDVPNLGANDGARLLPLTATGFRDFRPTLQLAGAVLAGRRFVPAAGPWDDGLRWLGVSVPDRLAAPPASRTCDDGGYVVLIRGGARAVLRYPRFRFRPSHADPLHVDLWAGGENLLRDAGTYSYAAPPAESAAFAGVAGHCTVQFDDREPMPRLGRFLFGDWLEATGVRPAVDTARAATGGAAYHDRTGATHVRQLELENGRLVIRDEVAGFARHAVWRWRLRPGPWRLDSSGVTDGRDRLTVVSDPPPVRMEIVAGWESRFYLQKTPVPVVEVELDRPGRVTTEYCWTA